MEVKTNTPKVQAARRTTLELLLSTHDKKCLSCVRVRRTASFRSSAASTVLRKAVSRATSPHYEHDDKHTVTSSATTTSAFSAAAVSLPAASSTGHRRHRRRTTAASTPASEPRFEVEPQRGSLHLLRSVYRLYAPPVPSPRRTTPTRYWDALRRPDKARCRISTAPSVRATLGECFGMPIGTNVEGKMVAALRRLGFDRVFDTDFAADLTIMEEAQRACRPHEERRHAPDDHLLLARMDQVLRALLTRICLTNLSSCKSPQQMVGRGSQDLLRRKGRYRPEGYRFRVGHALHREEVRDRQRDDQSASGYPGC